jgi:hypothetical protein
LVLPAFSLLLRVAIEARVFPLLAWRKYLVAFGVLPVVCLHLGDPATIAPVSFDFQRAVNQTMKIIQKTQNTSGGEQHDSNQDDALNDEADFSISGK